MTAKETQHESFDIDYKASYEEAIKLLGEYRVQLSEKEKQLSEAHKLLKKAIQYDVGLALDQEIRDFLYTKPKDK